MSWWSLLRTKSFARSPSVLRTLVFNSECRSNQRFVLCSGSRLVSTSQVAMYQLKKSEKPKRNIVDIIKRKSEKHKYEQSERPIWRKRGISNDEKQELFYFELNRRVNLVLPSLAQTLKLHEPLSNEEWEKIRRTLIDGNVEITDAKIWSYVLSHCVEDKNFVCGKSFIKFCVGAKIRCRGFMAKVRECELVAKLNPRSDLSSNEWDQLCQEVKEYHHFGDTVDDQMVEALVVNHCFKYKLFDCALSFLNYIKSTHREPSLFFLMMFMHLCGECADRADAGLILEIYQKIRNMSTLFDPNSTSNIIAGLSHTPRWEECVGLMESVKEIQPEPRARDCNFVAAAAFRCGNFAKGWEMLNVMKGKALFERTCLTIMDSCSGSSVEAQERMKEFLDYCAVHHIQLTDACTDALKEWFERRYEVEACYTTVQPSGKCDHCSHVLEDNTLTKEEFGSLRKHVMDDVVVGIDAYMKSNPKEIARFKTFVNGVGPYDAVIDALNLAFCQNEDSTNDEKAKQLNDFVRYLVLSKKKVVLIGRKHMIYWNGKYMNYVRNNAFCFFTDNSTKEDIFFLYAALKGGPNTILMSSDKLGDHCHQLENATIKSLFRRWQLRHQLFVKEITPTREMVFEDCIHYKTSLQCNSTCIHVPCLYVDPTLAEESDSTFVPGLYTSLSVVPSNEPPVKWLCIRRKGSSFLYS